MAARAGTGARQAHGLFTAEARRFLAAPSFRFAVVPASLAWLLLSLLWVRDVPVSLCLAPDARLADGMAAHLRAGLTMADPLRLAGEWALMVAAMMLPLTVPMVGHVAVRSFAARRTRAVSLFLGAYLLAWSGAAVAATLFLLTARAAVAALGVSAWAGLLGAVLAAAWQLSPAKSRALNRCHGTVPLRAFGRAADRDVAAFGLLHGRRCIAACAPLMVLPMLGGMSLAATAVIFILLLGERSQHFPQLDRSALILVLLGLAGVA